MITGTKRVCRPRPHKSHSPIEGLRWRPKVALYSVTFLIGEGRREYAEQLLGDARVADLPDLQARAERWLVAYRERVGHP